MSQNDPMSLIAEAQVQTEHAARYLAELCGQFDERAKHKPELGVRVEWTETDGSIDFGWGRCEMRADADALAFRAEATDEDGLRQIQELVRRHLEGHGEAGGLMLAWPTSGPPVADSHVEGRDKMRSFHRRMRH